MDLHKDKIAFLLYGEYRTFDVSNKFWDFKENSNIDFYFSTWNYSFQGNDKLNINHKENISSNSITKYFEKNIPFINIMDLQIEMNNYSVKHEKYLTFCEKAVPIHLRYLQKMLGNKWYDYIILSRPDVIFNNLKSLKKYNKEDNEILIPHGSISEEIVHDLFFCGNNKVMNDFINKSIDYNNWGHEFIHYLYTNDKFKFKEVFNFNVNIVRPNCRQVENLDTQQIYKLGKLFDKEKEMI